MMTNLIAVLVFFIVFTIMLWIMNDNQAERVTKSWSRLLKVLPISQIVEILKGKKPDSKTDDEP